MQKFSLPIGKRFEEIFLPEDKILYDIHGKKVPERSSIAEAALEAVRNPIGCEPLKKIAAAGEKVAIIVSDITRMVGTDEFLPVIVGELLANGVKTEDMTIVVATGTHRAHTREEDIAVCGADIVDKIKIHHHNCRDKSQLVDFGTTSRGTPVWLNKYVGEADKVIITGAVSLHPMAGFGGGRKAVLPGVAGYETIMHNHAMALADKVGEGCNPDCETSVLQGNPLHEDMMEACAMLKPAFLLNTVFTPDGKLYEVVAGHWQKAWEKGCRDLLDIAGIEIEQQADVVIASAGGFPKDMNLYQSCKCHMNAVFAVKKGGILIVTLECPDIKEPAIFTDWFAKGDILQLEKDVRADFSIPAFVAFKTRCIVNNLTVYFVTRPENFAFIERTGQIPAVSLEQAWNMAQQQLAKQGKKEYKITVMSHASATLPILKNS